VQDDVRPLEKQFLNLTDAVHGCFRRSSNDADKKGVVKDKGGKECLDSYDLSALLDNKTKKSDSKKDEYKRPCRSRRCWSAREESCLQ
jgi:hypothetical protein